MFRRFGAALAAIALGLATGQAAHAEATKYDASQVPLQMAAACYAVLFVIGEDHRGDMFVSEDSHKALMAAMQGQAETLMRQSGQPGGFLTAVRPMVDGLRQNFDILAAYDTRDRCAVAADAGMAKVRATPAANDALTCWAFLANTAPDDPQTAFLQTDTAVALTTFKVAYGVRDGVLHQARKDMGAVLAGPQGGAVKQQFAGCGAKVRVPLRKVAYVGDRWGVYQEGYGALKWIKDDLQAGLGGPLPSYFHQELWNMTDATWQTWIASPDAGDASICVGEYPYRDKDKPANGWTIMDIAVKVMTDLGVSREEAYVVLPSGAWKIDSDINRFSVKAGEACQAWGKAMAAKFGGTYYKAKLPF